MKKYSFKFHFTSIITLIFFIEMVEDVTPGNPEELFEMVHPLGSGFVIYFNIYFKQCFWLGA
jgi:ABC-type uncharacterized transport system permease subunit